MCKYKFSLFRTSSSWPLNMYLWYGANTLIFKLWKWNTFICKTSFLWVPFGLLPDSNKVWLYQEQVGHFLIISWLQSDRKKNLSSNIYWCFLQNSGASRPFPIKSWSISSLPCSTGPGRPVWDLMCYIQWMIFISEYL